MTKSKSTGFPDRAFFYRTDLLAGTRTYPGEFVFRDDTFFEERAISVDTTPLLAAVLHGGTSIGYAQPSVSMRALQGANDTRK